MAMNSSAHLAEPLDPAAGRACPRCRGSVFRIPRRLLDRLISRFVPVQRYRCCSRRCSWEGNRLFTIAPSPGTGSAAAAAMPGADARALSGAEPDHVRFALDSLGDAVLCTDVHARVSYLNGAAEALTGWTRAEALGRPLDEVFVTLHPAAPGTTAGPAPPSMANDGQILRRGMCTLLHRDGIETAIEDSVAPLRNAADRVVGAVIAFRDVSGVRAAALDMMRLAHHDALTGLPNRLLLAERLAQAIRHARRRDKQVALLFVDLDRFKRVNDSRGHAFGDRLLCSVARRLQDCVRETDSVCRLGGDEFVILLAELAVPLDATRVAEKLLAAFAAPHWIQDRDILVTLSIGISLFPDDAHDVDAVMGNADSAMYQAKTRGGNAYQLFSTGSTDFAAARAPALGAGGRGH